MSGGRILSFSGVDGARLDCEPLQGWLGGRRGRRRYEASPGSRVVQVKGNRMFSALRAPFHE